MVCYYLVTTMENLLKKSTANFSNRSQILLSLGVIFVMIFGILCTTDNSIMMANAGTSIGMDQMTLSAGDPMNKNIDHCNQSDACGWGPMQHSVLGNLTIIPILFAFAVATLLVLISRFKHILKLPKALSFSRLFNKSLVLKQLIPQLKVSLFKIFDPIKIAFSKGLIHPQLYN